MPAVSSEACKRTGVPYGSANLCCRHASCIMERATYAVPTNRAVVNAAWYFSQWENRPYCGNDKKNTQQHKTFTAGGLRRCMISHFLPLLVKWCIFSTHPPTHQASHPQFPALYQRDEIVSAEFEWKLIVLLQRQGKDCISMKWAIDLSDESLAP